MNLSRINLNLLVVLDVLLREKHVTKASQKLHVTQSTVSAALNQLREIFHDELLVREKNNMVLTSKAQYLAPKIQVFLQQLQNNIFNEVDFDPKTAKVTFTLAMNDYLECLLLAELNYYLAEHAPGVKCVVKHADFLDDRLFTQAKPVDLAIGVLGSEVKYLSQEELFAEQFVCAGNADNPLLKKSLKLAQYLQATHLSLSDPDYPRFDTTDLILKKMGKERNIKLNVTHISTALYLLVSSVLLATVPLTLAKRAKTLLNLTYQDLPFKMPNITIHQVWHAQHDHDAAHRWLRGVVKEILQYRLQVLNE